MVYILTYSIAFDRVDKSFWKKHQGDFFENKRIVGRANAAKLWQNYTI